MEPYGRMSMEELAMVDPVAAYGRLRGYPTAPCSFNAQASFSSLTLDQVPIKVPLDQIITVRTWIDNITFEVQLPNAFVGNIFLPDALSKMRDSPGVSVRTTVMSGPRYLVGDTYTPIENYTNIMASRWLAGWQILKYQQVQTEFMLTQIPFNDPSNTPPYIVNLTYNGWQFVNGGCDDVSSDFAIEKLVDAGILCKTGIPRCYDPSRP
jgi:hypothetical protein